MKKKLLLFLLIIIIACSLLTSLVNGLVAEKSIDGLLDREIESTFSQISNKVQIYQTFLTIFQKQMCVTGSSALKSLAGRFMTMQAARAVSGNELKIIARNLGIDEIYFIGLDGIVFNTSFQPDLNLNLYALSDEFKTYLKGIMNKGLIVSQPISLSTQTGTINAYQYYSSTGSNFTIEISQRLDKYLEQETSAISQPELKSMLFDSLLRQSQFVKDIDILGSSEGMTWSFINQGTMRPILPSQIMGMKLGDFITLKKGTQETIIRRNSGDSIANSFITTLVVFDKKYEVNFLERIAITSALLMILISAVIYFISSSEMNRKYIRRIESINKSIGQISAGNYYSFEKLEGHDELANISANIGLMSAQITTRENELNRIGRYFKSLTDSLPSVIIIIDENGLIEMWNTMAMKLTGISSEAALKRRLYEVEPRFVSLSRQIETVIDRHGCENSNRNQFFYPLESFFNITIFEFAREEHQHVIIMMTDVTELVKDEMILEQTQKMETVGTLTSGLAHNFSNIIAGIIGSTSLIKKELEADGKKQIPAWAENIEIIEEAAQRGNDIVQTLLSLARKQSVKFVPVDLNSIILSVIKLCKNTFDSSVYIESELNSEKAMVNGDRSQLGQIFLNIFINSEQAMTIMRKKNDEWGGTLRVSTERISGRSFKHRYPSAKIEDVNYWAIYITDQGVGMNTATIARIFDPFFTTKKQEKGTGLGMTMVYNMVRNHRGVIDIQSEPSKGTMVTLFLPVMDPLTENYTDAERETAGTGPVIVIESDATVRSLAGKMLEMTGFTPIPVRNCAEGRALIDNAEESFAAVLLDYDSCDGELSNSVLEIRKFDPFIPIIITIGVDTDEAVAKIKGAARVECLRKPYSLTMLTEAMIQALTEREKENG